MKEIFNINDIKNIIFIYLRKNPHKICNQCEIILEWEPNNKINDYLYLHNNKSFCFECFRQSFFSQHYPNNYCVIT